MLHEDNKMIKKGGKPETLGKINRALILNLLREEGNMSRADLSRRLSVSFPAISSNVKSLLEMDYIKEVGAGDNSIGRKSTMLTFNENRGYIIGVDLGRFWIRVQMADLLGNILAGIKEPTDVRDEQATMEEIRDLLNKVVEKSGKDRGKVSYICIGIPGVLHGDEVMLAPFLPDISLNQLRTLICEDFQAKVVFENSINLGAIGEKWKGVGAKYHNFAFINYGVGVGASLVINGELYRGTNNAAGEIGFMISDPKRLRKSFNEIGTLENVIARDKINEYLSHGPHDNFQDGVNQLIKRYEADEEDARVILDEIFISIGLSLINLSAILDLEAIIISGGLGMGLGKLFAGRWEEQLKHHVPFPPKILFSNLDNQEGSLGAISVGIEDLHKFPTEF